MGASRRVAGTNFAAPFMLAHNPNDLRRFIARSIQAAMSAGFGCLPNHVLRIASRTSEPTPGE
jgi:hypothetical protein